jgi:DNA-binding MarR family transcriptional regulator
MTGGPTGRSRFSSAMESPGFLLWHASLRWQRLMRRTLQPLGLTHVQFVLLASTWWLGRGGEPPTQRELADHAGTDAMMTSQVCRALQERGLLTRNPDPRDSRAVRLELTPAGRALAPEAVEAVEAADEAFFSTAPDPAVVRSLLHSLATGSTD